MVNEDMLNSVEPEHGLNIIEYCTGLYWYIVLVLSGIELIFFFSG